MAAVVWGLVAEVRKEKVHSCCERMGGAAASVPASSEACSRLIHFDPPAT